MYNNHSTQDCYIENEMGRMKMRNRQKILTVLAAILFGTLPLTGCQDAGAPEDTKIQQQEEMQEPAISDQESETDSVLEDTEPLEPDTDNDQVLLDPALRQEEQTAETERAAGSDDGGSIDSLREYIFPDGEIPVFYIERGNYRQQIPVPDYSAFDADSLIDRMHITGNEESSDTDQDGRTDKITCMGESAGWARVDKNGDGKFDYFLVIESNYNSTVDFQVEWTDCDGNGTVDEIRIQAADREDLARNRFSAQYIYADYQVLDYDTGRVDYTNQGRVQLIQMVTLPYESPFDEQQFFRDYNGDGYVDMMQSRRYYDTDNDGVKESMKISSDRDMDGVFEDEYAYDGTIFDDSLIYDY